MSDSIGLLRQTLPAVLPRLRRFARTLAHNAPDADDLAQNTIERALTRAAQWRAPAADATSDQVEAAVRSWMFSIMKNTWIDEFRSRKRERAVFGGNAVDNVADGAHTAQDDQLSIMAAMQRLPEEQQLAVSLVLVEGLTYQEAAEVLEIPVGTLTSRLSRGREMLATLLDAAGATA